MDNPLRIGISACLLGQEVRFDGGHKRDPFLTEILGPHVEWVPVCPEVEMGLGTPRETLRLVRVGNSVRMITTRTAVDHTGGMNAWSGRRLDALAFEGLSGYVLKKDSPSCGMERVKVYDGAQGVPARNGRGLFAAALLERFPLLPVEEEGRLSDPRLRENFIERVFAHRRLSDLFGTTGRGAGSGSSWSLGALVAFHTAHKMSLLSHSTTAYQELGQLVARAKELPRSELRSQYQALFMKTLAIPATTRRHTNVLTHMAGHLKKVVDAESRQELAACIDEYRRGLVPLVVPLTLIRHHVRVHDVEYLKGQVYLDPHPRELMLRNHV
jgi:uncharacterized protein YbgA (DUF1722 family)/uncharacterized protein YbbK (DUF523 family)